MKDNRNMHRRSFVRAGLFAGAAAATGAWLARRIRPSRPTPPASLGSRFQYDLDAFRHTDPALVRYRETGAVPTGFQRARALALGPEGAAWVAGDRSVKRLDASGRTQSEHAFDKPPRALAALPDGSLLVSLRDTIVRLGADGGLHPAPEPFGEKTWITAFALHGDAVYLADAGNREVIRCTQDLRPVARFGRRGEDAATPGFIVPSPFFDLTAEPGGALVIANPGRHRVERYTADGRFLSAWGQPGMAIKGFSGCCNPAHLARLPDGRILTSEKGLHRVKIYTADGRFEGVVAGADYLAPNPEAPRAADPDDTGTGFPVAADGNGQVVILDPVHNLLRRFTPLTA